MEDFRLNNKTRFGHFYDVTDKEEQILFHRCSLRVEAYIKAHVYNQSGRCLQFTPGSIAESGRRFEQVIP